MNPRCLVVYATREGQARKVAERMAATLGAHGAVVQVHDASALDQRFVFDGVAGVILVASVHVGKHEREMVKFVREHREALDRTWAAFVSVSMSAATVEGSDRSVDAKERASGRVRLAFDQFAKETGWRAPVTLPVAGALRYSQYGFFVRWFMRAIAKRTGADTDTSRDYEYTDWAAVDRFASGFADAVRARDIPHAPS